MLPKRTEFFELLAAHSERVLAGANAMLRLITSLGVSQADVAALVQEINMNEASADQIKADLMTMLHKSFVTPLNRDQVYALTLDIDRVMNAVQDVAQAVGIYNITEVNAESRELASMAVEACSRLTRAIAALKEKERSDTTSTSALRSSASKRSPIWSCNGRSRRCSSRREMIVRLCGRWACGSSMRCRRRCFVAARLPPRCSKRS
jgi:uncharacterized protein Yka (UPF0111/DUF47 family)